MDLASGGQDLLAAEQVYSGEGGGGGGATAMAASSGLVLGARVEICVQDSQRVDSGRSGIITGHSKRGGVMVELDNELYTDEDSIYEYEPTELILTRRGEANTLPLSPPTHPPTGPSPHPPTHSRLVARLSPMTATDAAPGAAPAVGGWGGGVGGRGRGVWRGRLHATTSSRPFPV